MQNLTPAEVQTEYRIAQSTLANWRWQGRGPAYVKVGGRVLYRRTDLDRWLDANTHGGNDAGAA